MGSSGGPSRSGTPPPSNAALSGPIGSVGGGDEDGADVASRYGGIASLPRPLPSLSSDTDRDSGNDEVPMRKSILSRSKILSASIADLYVEVMKEFHQEVQSMDLSVSRSTIGDDEEPPAQPMWSDRVSRWGAVLKRRVPYYVPFLAWLPSYRPRMLLQDVPAGIAVASMLIPQSLVFASLAGLDPVRGIYTAMVPLVLYALMGNSRQLSIGPEALMSTLVGIAVLSDANEDANPVDVACILALLAGVVSFLLGIFRFGFIDSVLSRPLLGGFINAVAVIIVVNQLDTLMGLSDYTRGMLHLEKFVTVLENLEHVRWQTVVVSLASVCFLLGARILKSNFTSVRLVQFFPETLLLVVAATLTSYVLDFQNHNVAVLGHVDSSFPIPRLPPIFTGSLVVNNIGSATLFAVVGFIESIIAAKFYARKHQYRVSSNRELVAYGLANMAGSVFGAYPCFGSLPRSLVADTAGAKSQVFALVVVGIITVALFFLSTLVYYLPLAAMSAIVFVAALGLLEWEEIVFLLRMGSYKEILMLALTFVLTVVLGPEYGVLASLGVSIFVLIQRTSSPSMTLLGRVDATTWKDLTLNEAAVPLPGVLVLRLECDRIFFANIEMLREMLYRVEKLGSFVAHPSDEALATPIHTIVIDMRNVLEIDATGFITLRELSEDYRHRGISVYLTRNRPEIHEMLARSGVADPITGLMTFATISEAVEHSRAYRVA